MGNRRVIFIADLIYVAVMTLCSLFYVLADFGKAITGRLGLAQLAFSVVTLIILILRRSKRDGLPIHTYLLYSAAQFVAVFFWIAYFSVSFQVFPGIRTVNWLGLTVHLLLIGWGIGAIIIKKRGLPQTTRDQEREINSDTVSASNREERPCPPL